MRSYNGWSASPDLAIRPLVVAGEEFIPGIRDNDDVYTVLQYLAQQLHERVEPIVRDDWHQADDWGFNFRLTTGDTDSLSNHSSGTALDYNATRHPFGVPASRNFTREQIDTIHEIIDWIGVIEWGGDYRNTPDAMHFDIKGTVAEVHEAAERIRAKQEEEDMPTPKEVADALLASKIEVKRGTKKVKITIEQALKEIFNNTVGGR